MSAAHKRIPRQKGSIGVLLPRLSECIEEYRVFLTRRRSAVRCFPEAQNGTYRFVAISIWENRIMPRLSHALPKYRKHRGSGQAVVTLNGRDFYLGPHNTKASKWEYDRLIGEWLANGRGSLHATSQDIHIVELCLRYWKYAKGHYQKNGRCTRVTPGIKCALRYLKDLYGKTPAAEFGPLALKAIRERMIEDALSRTYINDHLGRIKRMFKWAVGPSSRFRRIKGCWRAPQGQNGSP